MTISQERIERVAMAYASAWKADIKEHLGADVISWGDMGENQRDAMRRCARAALEADAPALAEAERKGRMEGLEIAAPVIEAVRLFFANWRERQGGVLALRQRLKEFDARLSELEKGEGR